jgi:hypothetical protein
MKERRVMLVLNEVCNVYGFTSVYEATTTLPTLDFVILLAQQQSARLTGFVE